MDRSLPDLDWGGTHWFRALGYYFGIRTNSPGHGEYLAYLLEPFAVERDGAEERNPPTPGYPPRYTLADMGEATAMRHRLWLGEGLMFVATDPEPVLENLLWHVNAETVFRTGEFVMIHAGAVTGPGGHAVVIPGASGAGKSTLVAGLVVSGFGYLSDEVAAFDPITHAVHPYPRAITLKDQTVVDAFPELAGLGRKLPRGATWHLNVHASGFQVRGDPTEAAYIIVPAYEPGSTTSVARISAGEAALVMGQNCASLHRYGGRCLPLLAKVTTGAECYRLVSGDLRSAAAAVIDTIC